MNDSARHTPPPSSAPPAEGDPLAHTPYRFLGRLGEGGMGEVMEAEHVTLGQRVAIKLLREEYFARVELKDRMRVEAQAGARIRHDNLVLVTDFGETADGRVFIVMERLYGRSLADELHARGFLPVVEAADIAQQALAGLSAAHAAALVHRDIKPDNLFLCDLADGARRVKVLDLGIAKIRSHAMGPLTPAPLAQPTADGTTVGTPRWMSPEQCYGAPDIDARSDVYSMGWVLYTMLTGRAPFPHLKQNADLFAAHGAQMPPAPSTAARQPIPAELDAIVMKAIAKRREDRFPTAEAFRLQLGPFLAPAPVLATGTFPSTPVFTSTGTPAASAATSPGPRPLAATVTQSPAGAGTTVVATVDASDIAIARPAIPWAQTAPPPPGKRGNRLPAWFFAVLFVGIGGTIVAVVIYLWA